MKLLPSLTLTVLLSLTQALPAAEPARPMVVAYVPNWIDLAQFSSQINYAQVTHLNVAFENPVDAEGNLSFNFTDQALLTAAATYAVPVFVSIGGGSASGDKKLLARYAALLGADQRVAFANKLADYVLAHHFAGLDVDLEGPSITADYGPFIQQLGGAFARIGKPLTAALSQGYGGDKVPPEVFAIFSWVNIMAYDGKGYWNLNDPGQHSSLALAKSSVAYWLERGLPKAKAVLGVPFYGYGFGTAAQKRDYPYRKILAQFPEAAQLDQVGATIWYNGIPTIQAKAKFMREAGLAGIMIWSLDSDAEGESSLLRALHTSLQAP